MSAVRMDVSQTILDKFRLYSKRIDNSTFIDVDYLKEYHNLNSAGDLPDFLVIYLDQQNLANCELRAFGENILDLSTMEIWETSTQPSSTLTTEAPIEITTEDPIEFTSEAPTEPPTEPPTEAPTEPATEAPTESPTEPLTEPPTEPATEPATEPPTEPPTEPATEAPTEAPIELTTESPIEITTEGFIETTTQTPETTTTTRSTVSSTSTTTTLPTPTTTITSKPCNYSVEITNFNKFISVREDAGYLSIVFSLKPNQPACSLNRDVKFYINTTDYTATQDDYQGKFAFSQYR
jgi:outer membrane biosynthesis protein TonB